MDGVTIMYVPVGGTTLVSRVRRCSGRGLRLPALIGSRPAAPTIPVSTIWAWGRYCRRTIEPVPSAPTSTSPVVVVPSSKKAVTRPSGVRS
jgi:hypothetical protein